uniref:Potassium channel tetramerization domain containing 21 n=2 Tax=Canis lupus familiaris TaxID=9615 RepID=A0A8C0SGQ7_CANLF
MWVRRINAEAITQSNFQYLFHEDLKAVDLLVGWHHPEPLEVLLGVLLLWQALHIGHPVQSQVVGVLQVAGDGGEIAIGAVEELGAKELKEEARGTEDVGVEDLHAGGGEAIDLRCLPHSEVDCLHTLVQGDVEHGILLGLGQLHLLLLQCINQGLHLVEVSLSSEQAHLLEVLRQVQVGGPQEVEDVAEHFAIAVNEAVALAVPLGGHLPTEHGTQHGVREAGQGCQ